MDQASNVQLNVLVPRIYHDLLVRMAARRNLADPQARATKGSLAREFLCASLSELVEETRGGTDDGTAGI